jgi:nicotinic acid mononucleotide adenylyltransferase
MKTGGVGRSEIARGDDVSAMVPRAVLSYARDHGLYAGV